MRSRVTTKPASQVSEAETLRRIMALDVPIVLGGPSTQVPRLALSADEAAATLGVSRDFFDQHIRPSLRVVRLGRRVIVPVAELEKWLHLNASLALEGRQGARCT